MVRESLEEACSGADTIRSILISKAETVFLLDDKKYEAQVSIYAVEDSLIYVSAVNSGFEIIRALVEPDTIQVIDRVNKVLYRTPVRKRFGYQNPLNFRDIQNLVSCHYLCDDLAVSRKVDNHIRPLYAIFGSGRRLFDKITVVLHAGEFSYTFQGYFAPPSAHMRHPQGLC